MNIDENQASQHHYLEQKKYLRQNDTVLRLGSQLVRSGSIKGPIKDMLNTLVKELEYLYVKVTIHASGSNDDKKFEYASDASVASQVGEIIERVENETKRTLTFKMSPIQNRLEVKHTVFKVKRSYDCFAVSKPLLYSGCLLGVISGVKANVGSMNPRAEQTLMTLLSHLISQSIVIEKSGTSLSVSSKSVRSQKFDTTGIVGNSQQLMSLFAMMKQVAFTDTSVLLQGEAGIGKGVFAKCLHANSGRSSQAFVKFNGSIMDEATVEKALFGFEDENLISGAISQAEKGTLHIDAIEALPLKTQSKLLRLVKERKYEVVGSDKTFTADIRLVLSSAEKLEDLVVKGRFLSELYYSIASFPINIPSLKDRKSDIIPLADYFIEKYTFLHGKKVSRISTPAIDMLSSYHWPGNVRELEGCIERAVLLTNESVIRGHHLPPSLQKVSSEAEAKGIDLKGHLDSVEKELILDALKDARGNMAKAARLLGLTERVMGLRVNSHGINVKKFKSQNT